MEQEIYVSRRRLTEIFKNFILNNWEVVKSKHDYTIKSHLTYTANYTWTNGPGLYFEKDTIKIGETKDLYWFNLSQMKDLDIINQDEYNYLSKFNRFGFFETRSKKYEFKIMSRDGNYIYTFPIDVNKLLIQTQKNIDKTIVEYQKKFNDSNYFIKKDKVVFLRGNNIKELNLTDDTILLIKKFEKLCKKKSVKLYEILGFIRNDLDCSIDENRRASLDHGYGSYTYFNVNYWVTVCGKSEYVIDRFSNFQYVFFNIYKKYKLYEKFGLHFDNDPNIGSSLYTTRGGYNHVS